MLFLQHFALGGTAEVDKLHTNIITPVTYIAKFRMAFWPECKHPHEVMPLNAPRY